MDSDKKSVVEFGFAACCEDGLCPSVIDPVLGWAMPTLSTASVIRIKQQGKEPTSEFLPGGNSWYAFQ